MPCRESPALAPRRETLVQAARASATGLLVDLRKEASRPLLESQSRAVSREEEGQVWVFDSSPCFASAQCATDQGRDPARAPGEANPTGLCVLCAGSRRTDSGQKQGLLPGTEAGMGASSVAWHLAEGNEGGGSCFMVAKFLLG